MADGITATWHAEALDHALDKAIVDSEAATVLGFTAMGETLKAFFASMTTHGETGQLAGSWDVVGPIAGGGEVVMQLGPTAKYGRRVELGFRGIHDGVHGHNPTGPRHYVEHALPASESVVIEGVQVTWNPERLFGISYG